MRSRDNECWLHVQDLQEAGLEGLLGTGAAVPGWAREKLKSMYRGLAIMTNMAGDPDAAWNLVSAYIMLSLFLFLVSLCFDGRRCVARKTYGDGLVSHFPYGLWFRSCLPPCMQLSLAAVHAACLLCLV